MSKRKVIFSITTSSVVALAVLYYVLINWTFVGKIEVINEAHSVIANGQIDAGVSTLTITGMKPGERRQFAYLIKSEGDYHLRLRLSSGKVIDKTVGYITTFVDKNDTMTITDDDVKLVQRYH